MKRGADERTHARLELLRELFGLDEAGVERRGAAGGRGGAGAGQRPLLAPGQAARSVTLRIATRASALARAQAGLVADALGGGELVEMVTAGDRAGHGRSGQVALGGRAGARGAGRRGRPGGALGQGRSGRAGRGAGDRGRARAGRRARRASAAPTRWQALAPGARVGTSQPAPPRAAGGAARRRGGGGGARQRGHAPAPPGRGRPRPGRAAAGHGRAGAPGPHRRGGLGAGPGASSCPRPARARWPSRRAPTTRPRAGRWRRSTTRWPRPACAPSARSPRRIGASCHTPVGAHAVPEGEDRLVLTAFAGAARRLAVAARPPGGRAGRSPRSWAARWASGCWPPAAASCWRRPRRSA